MIQLIAFLGNYGNEYAKTRHNTAWLYFESLPFASRINFSSKFKSDFASVDYTDFIQWMKDTKMLLPKTDKNGVEKPINIPEEAPKKLYFMKPMTYMNLSGDAIGEAAKFFKINPDEILVVHDEIELPLGTVGFKFSGGLGGHNGLRSTKTNLGTADFYRLRFGVGKPANGNVADYVLGQFTGDEQITLSQVFTITSNELLSKVLTAKDPMNYTQPWNKKKIVEL